MGRGYDGAIAGGRWGHVLRYELVDRVIALREYLAGSKEGRTVARSPFVSAARTANIDRYCVAIQEQPEACTALIPVFPGFVLRTPFGYHEELGLRSIVS